MQTIVMNCVEWESSTPARQRTDSGLSAVCSRAVPVHLSVAPPVLSLRVPEFFAKIFIFTTFQEKILDSKTKIGIYFLFLINYTIISFFHFLILVFLPFYVEQFPGFEL